jgi:serine O-acetyltransferase
VDVPGFLRRMREDIESVFDGDPAARTIWEVLACYPGLHAIWLHRFAHFLWQHRLLLVGRLVSQMSRLLTGVEIHPGARIGNRLFIDHGMGIVVGETAEIGDDVLMYQGAVLGGTSLERTKRHPTVGNHVVIGAGATILGPITVGDGARIGAGSVVIKSVPAGATVVGVPGRMAGPQSPKSGAELEHGQLPDPVLRVLSETLDRQSRLEERLQQLEQGIPPSMPLALPPREPGEPTSGEDGIREALRQVIDPEIGVNIVDLGLIQEIASNGRGVEVRMVLTSPGCPLAGYLVDQVQRRVRAVTQTEAVEVVILDRVWSWDDTAPHLLWGDGI